MLILLFNLALIVPLFVYLNVVDNTAEVISVNFDKFEDLNVADKL
jgi:hypothetical protein